MKIEIVNWDKYNPRTDAKAWSWFRMQNNFFDDPDMYDLGVAELMSFVYLCCERSKNGETPVFKVNPRQMAQKCRCNEGDILRAIEALEVIGRVIVHERRTDPYVGVRERTDDERIRPDLRATNVTERTERTERTGSQIASDLAPSHEPAEVHYEEPQAKPARKAKKAAADPTEGGHVFEAYRGAYAHRYGVDPKRNAMVNANCAQLVKRLGLDDAISVVRFYLTHGKAYYVSVSHALRACVQDAEALCTQMQTGQRTTQTQAQQVDRGQSNAEVFTRLAAKWAAEENAVKISGGEEQQ